MDKKYHFSELFAENPIIEEKDEEAQVTEVNDKTDTKEEISKA